VANSCFDIDGNVYVWHKLTGTLVHKAEAHTPRVNAVAWNPADPAMYATCGDDGKIKIWVPKEQARAYLGNKTQRSNGGPLRSVNSWTLLEANSRESDVEA